MPQLFALSPAAPPPTKVVERGGSEPSTSFATTFRNARPDRPAGKQTEPTPASPAAREESSDQPAVDGAKPGEPDSPDAAHAADAAQDGADDLAKGQPDAGPKVGKQIDPSKDAPQPTPKSAKPTAAKAAPAPQAGSQGEPDAKAPSATDPAAPASPPLAASQGKILTTADENSVVAKKSKKSSEEEGAPAVPLLSTPADRAAPELKASTSNGAAGPSTPVSQSAQPTETPAAASPDAPPATAAVHAPGTFRAAAREADKGEKSDKPADATAKIEKAAGEVLDRLAPAAETAKPAPAAAARPVDLPPEARFAADNVDRVVTHVRTELMPGGGTMSLRLDPPDLGRMQVTVEVRGGALSASFQAGTGEAAALLSHSLSHLKTALESAGLSVERLNVTQAPREPSASQQNSSDARQQNGGGADADTSGRQQRQQRQEMIRRMWARLGKDPLDLVA